jgi:Flp pilus assembly protein TadG
MLAENKTFLSKTSAGVAAPRRRRHGAAVLELALTLAILLNLTFGMVEFGYYFFVKNTCQGAARDGARAGIVTGATYSTTNTSASITTSVQTAMSAAGFGTSSPKYTFSVYDDTTDPTHASPITTDAGLAAVSTGDALEVDVQGTWSTIGAGFRPLSLIGSSKVVLGTAVMRHE